MFTSREPGQFPRDPEPWVAEYDDGTDVRHATAEGVPTGVVFRHSPRPEFDTPVNPILVAFRNSSLTWDWKSSVFEIGFYHWEVFGGFKAWNEEDHALHSFTVATPEQIEHARKVLTHLARLEEKCPFLRLWGGPLAGLSAP